MSPFRLVREQFVKEVNGMVREYRHEATGAEYISVENTDNNKVFGITFRTPPSDSTGAAHIVEHAVLCGSRKYPLKDPFVQLLKGSLQTFLNAMTYPDKTVYPAGSQNEQDFYNLADVYLDAVFFPRLTPDCFRQEGWHFEMNHPDGPLACKGVVYNEMKGAWSSPENILLERSQSVLFPDNACGFDSGGDPSCIPDLNYEDFRRFHERYYHPSNARIYFYGNDNPQRRMEILSDYLDRFERLEYPPDTAIPLQTPFAEPVEHTEYYAAGGKEKNKALITVNWALPETISRFSLILLDQILLGHSGSPLRKILIESGLGEEITGSGLETHLRQPVWSVGMEGVKPENLSAVETLIVGTLETLAAEGIDRNDIEAALNSFEFELRENNHGSFPRGLSIMLTMLETWLYEEDPLSLAAYELPLEDLKEKTAAYPRFFEDLIETILLKNPHRATVRLLPDPDKAVRDEAVEQTRFEQIRKKMSPEDLSRIADDAARLLQLQKTPDTPDAVKTLPMLRRKDLRKEIETVPRDLEVQKYSTILFHDLFTGGVVYIDLAFDLHALDAEDLPWVSLLGSLVFETGTRKEDFTSLLRRIAQKTGGVHICPLLSALEASPDSAAWFVLRGKCMTPQAGDLFDIFTDVLFEPAFDNRKRFREILLEQKADMEGSLIQNGHSAVLSRVNAAGHEAHRAAESISGIESLFFHRNMQKTIKTDWGGTVRRLEKILEKLTRAKRIVNITADGKDRAFIDKKLGSFLAGFPDRSETSSAAWKFPPAETSSEALLAPSRVNYVGCSVNLFKNGYKPDGASFVVTGYLRTAWLWEKIRVQGGAYGAMCRFDSGCGLLAFASYRDPNIKNTLETFRQTEDFLKSIVLDEDELTRTLIGTIGRADSHLLPDAKGYKDMIHYLTGQTDEKRQRRRDEILSTGVHHFREFGEYLCMRDAVVSVLSSPEGIKDSGIVFDRTLDVL